nr:MerR family transcriptional regulator [Candidatus Frankia alpina]
MRIGELARRTAVSERLLRYYEEQGLLHPARLSSGYRVYAESDVDQVRRIRTLLSAGLPTALIAQVLPCVRGGATWCRAPAWSRAWPGNGPGSMRGWTISSRPAGCSTR